MYFAKQYLSVPWSLFRKRSNFLVLTNTRLSRSEVINLQFSKFQFDSAKKSTLRVENWKEPPLLQAREKSSKSQVCKKRKTDYKLAPCPDLPEFIASKPRKWALCRFGCRSHGIANQMCWSPKISWEYQKRGLEAKTRSVGMCLWGRRSEIVDESVFANVKDRQYGAEFACNPN